MWVIYQGVSGYQYPTTKEKETIQNPYYLIKFVHDSTNQTRYCICSDSSVYPERNQRFKITETGTPVSGNGEVKLDHLRSWKYFIYESVTVPVIETGLKELEQGRVKVFAPTSSLNKYEGYQTTKEEHE